MWNILIVERQWPHSCLQALRLNSPSTCLLFSYADERNRRRRPKSSSCVSLSLSCCAAAALAAALCCTVSLHEDLRSFPLATVQFCCIYVYMYMWMMRNVSSTHIRSYAIGYGSPTIHGPSSKGSSLGKLKGENGEEIITYLCDVESCSARSITVISCPFLPSFPPQSHTAPELLY